MNDYFGGQSPQELEALLRKLITQGAEGPKVDFKRTFTLGDKAAQAELAKDISSIANTDDEAHLDDFGYIILGAERGKLIGGVSDLTGNIDKLQAQITDVIKAFVGPVPQFSLSAFDDSTLGRWGVIVIPPSARQPHLLVRDGAGDVVKHEWWVRVNDTKERAGPHDYARFLAKATRREVRPLELEVQRLALKVDQRTAPDVAALVDALRGSAVESAAVAQVCSAPNPTALVRRLLMRAEVEAEESLITEALSVAEVMNETSERNPWLLARMTAEQLGDLLDYLEERTFPLVEAFATVARYDRGGALTDGVCRALRVIARQPQPTGAFTTIVPEFRLYPLVLCLYALAIIGTNEGKGDLLRRVFELSLQRDEREGVAPIVVAAWRVRAGSDIFNTAAGQRYFEPVAMRVREVLLPRLSGLLVGTPSKEAFFVAEFVLALAFLNVRSLPYSAPRPLPGTYLYDRGAPVVLKAFLEQRPGWLGAVLGANLESLLAEFDATVPNIVQQGGWADGFTGGAAAAFGTKGPP